MVCEASEADVSKADVSEVVTHYRLNYSSISCLPLFGERSDVTLHHIANQWLRLFVSDRKESLSHFIGC